MAKQTSVTNTGIPEPYIPQPPDTGCQRGEDNRKSDLCAQWKAADGAYDAASYGIWQLWIGWIGLVLGGATMAAAIAAARYARRAAVATEATVAIAKGSSEEAIEMSRPWLDVSVKPKFIRAVGSDIRFDYEVTIKNIGKTVARTVQHFHHVIDTRAKPRIEIAELTKQWEGRRRASQVIIVPGSGFTRVGCSIRSASYFQIGLDAINRPISPALVVHVMYKNANDDDNRQCTLIFLIARYATPNGVDSLETIRHDLGFNHLPISGDHLLVEPTMIVAT